jgi:MtN3 and saliva related transmembrane protein
VKLHRMIIVKTDIISLLGFLAGALTTVAYLPQVIKTWRSKSAKDISLVMVSLSSTGIFLWFVYGLYIRSAPVIVANLVTFVLISLVLFLKIRYQ